MEALTEFWTWFTALDTPFAFLVALPFGVGALGVGALAFEQRRRATRRSLSPLQRTRRPAHVQ